jgi:NADH-quinone oxidoreductase subunit A
MTELVLLVVIFVTAGAALLLGPLVMGKLVRPDRPSPEKGEVYECGEPAVGSAWVQFDLRFYVVALLFVIFDVELAFFFPWAVVFGSATQLSDPALTSSQRGTIEQRLRSPGDSMPNRPIDSFEHVDTPKHPSPPAVNGEQEAAAAKQLAWLAFADVAVFFGVLLVGFAYLWRRGDLEWVRSTAGQAGATHSVSADAVE